MAVAPLVFLLLLLCPLFSFYSYEEGAKAGRLLKERNIDPATIPVPLNKGGNLMVEVSFLMTGLVAVDIARENVKFTAAIFLRWTDFNLAWDLKDANASFVMRSARDIWYPQLLLTTSINELTILRPDPRFDHIVIKNDGSITMQLYKTYEISCKAYVAKFPLDSVSCDMKLLGIYDTSYLRFIPWNSSMDDQIVFKNSNSEWIVKNLTFHSKQEKQRLFETEYTTEMMNIHMLIQRSPEYYIIILQIPMCLLTAMLIMTSWIPPSSGERIGFVINLCLSFILFLLLLDSLLPRSNYSAMSLCVLFSYVLSILNLLECVVVNYFHHRYNCDDAVCHPVTSIANDLTTPREIHFFDGTEKLKWIRYLQRLDTIMFAVNVVSLIVMIISLLSTLLS